MTFYFAPIADGMGDLLISLPGLVSLINTGEPTYLVVRSPKQEQVAELVAGLAGSIREPDFLCKAKNSEDVFINLRDHPMQTEFVFGSENFQKKFGPVNMVDVCRLVCHDLIEKKLNIPVDFSYKPFPFEENKDAVNKVLLIPGSAGRFKCWPNESWLKLYEHFSSRGIDCLVLGQPEKSPEVLDLISTGKSRGLSHLPTNDLVSAVNALSSAQAVVSVDTGLMHLAVQQNTPTIAFHLRRSIFARPEKCCISIFAEDCIPECLFWINDTCDKSVVFENYEEKMFKPCFGQQSCKRLADISVEEVISQFEKLVGQKSARVR